MIYFITMDYCKHTAFVFALKKRQWSDLEGNNNWRRCIGIWYRIN